ncbi:receptor-like protein kinase HERK 1 [Rutidosis leptorrhynchoides]|uniref:receptor-like protein kinase HERK 1 n=1 Tax=Rutidosis leptorrhynchoides TaxID=125765 RepID=UPI003A99E1A8
MTSTLTTEFVHLQIPLEDVAKATNNFSDKNIIGKGDFGNVYKGKLKNSSGESIKIAARRLDRRHGQGDVEFWIEVSMLCNLKHENITSMIGFCDENGEKIIIHHHYRKGSLNLHVSKTTLTGYQRIMIAKGIADALAYLHDIPGENYHVIHRNINSSTILLDENWVPKLSGFEFCVKHSKDRKNEVFICEPIGTKGGYIDPETHKTGGVTYKSDVYSMGLVFFEMLYGRKVKGRETVGTEVPNDLWNQDRRSILFSNTLTREVISCTYRDRKSRDDAVGVSFNLSRRIKDWVI